MTTPETLEIATLVGGVATALIAVAQIFNNTLRRTKLENGIEILDLAQILNCDTSSFNNAIKPKLQALCVAQQSPLAVLNFVWQIFFSVVVLTGFSCLAANLYKNDLTQWSIIAAMFALVGLILLIVSWTDRKHLNTKAEQISSGIASYVSAPVTVPAAAPGESLKAPQMQEKEEAVSAAPRPTPEAKPAQTAPPSVYKPRIPTDSILKRHFITHIRSEIEAGMSPHPSDSILKRHYEHLLETKLSMRLADMEG